MRKNRIQLPNGCLCSTPSIYPQNWRSCSPEDLNKTWRIQYYFYDKDGNRKLVIVKGMNSYYTLSKRREVTRLLYQDELKELKEGYNPILKRYIIPDSKGVLNGDLRVLEAFWLAFKKLETEPKHNYQIKNAIDRIEYSILELKFHDIKIKNFKRSQLKQCFDFLKLPNTVYNKFKAYFSAIYKILIEYECVDVNITRDIHKKIVVKKQRKVLGYDEALDIISKLKQDRYNFYRYSMIFLHSGARTAELLKIRAKDVRIGLQEYDVLVKKGNQYEWKTKVILQKALPYWNEILSESSDEREYLFSEGLKPGIESINPHQITKRWRIHVKKKYNVVADFYSLKHTLLDHLDEKSTDFDFAQNMASHSSSAITHKVYTLGKARRELEVLKRINL